MSGPSTSRSSCAALVAAVALTSGAAPAGATLTFGADLALTPDLSFHCPLAPPFFGPYLLPSTCTAFTSGVFGGGPAPASHLVPDGTGVITKLRLREPEVTSSPLKMTVLQALRTPQNPPIAVHTITTVTGVYELTTPGTTGGSAPAPGRPLTVSGGRFAGHTATIPLVCELTTACTGTLRLQDTAPKVARAAAARTPKLYGSAKFTIKAGRKASVKITLNAAGRRLVARHRSVSLYASARLGGGQVVTTKVKLRPA